MVYVQKHSSDPIATYRLYLVVGWYGVLFNCVMVAMHKSSGVVSRISFTLYIYSCDECK